MQKQTLTTENYTHCYYCFRTRQAGISEIYDPKSETYAYNSYCLEQELTKEIYSVEFNFLEDAIEHINEEFGNWEFRDLSLKKQECGSCDNAK